MKFERLAAPPSVAGLSAFISVARVRPRTSKGITDLLWPYLLWLNANCPSKKFACSVEHLFVFHKSKNFTSDNEVRMPPTVPINHYFGSENQQNRTKVLFYYSMLSKSLKSYTHSIKSICSPQEEEQIIQYSPLGGPSDSFRNPTTSFLTATTLIYAIGAGITAAAGTRLALQWILVKGFKLYSFRLRSQMAPYRYFLSLPPRVGIG
ncbi:predicted protein [Trichoplax adhaerens]|uniref:Uncharacterized protein n=1 Tax=Trichoplax adhaerens TaxID=10228 RepID=B3SDC0_TRIAD|nr:predicted protein [Trichoplax adhaerens]EDV19242.1 predicted protein [Trichoplax adhaerens]|eukprot:XP_002118239.1 predicted protein [Trichoplax adhaerens]